MINVTGYRILIKAEEIEKVTGGGIIIVQDEKLVEAGQQFGEVIGIGKDCWTDNTGKYLNPWCKEGDKVLYAKHAGRFVYDPDTNEEYMILNDTDILAVIN